MSEDLEFQRVLSNGGTNPSWVVDDWVVNRLTAYRVFHGFDVSVPFEDLPIIDCVRLLEKFFEQACKVNGKLYPSQSIMGLYLVFDRILRRAQDRRVMATGVVEARFSMRNAPLFKHVSIACVLAMRRSQDKGIKKPCKKCPIVSMEDERIILSHACTSKLSSRALQ